MNDAIAVDVPTKSAPLAVPKPISTPLPSVPAPAPVSKFNEKPEPPKVVPKPTDTKPAPADATAGSGLARVTSLFSKKNAVIGASALFSLAAGIAGVKFLLPGDENPEPTRVASKALNSGPTEPQRPSGPGVAVERTPAEQIEPTNLPVAPVGAGPVAPPPSPHSPTIPAIPDGTSGGGKPAPLPPSIHPDPNPSGSGLPEPSFPLPSSTAGSTPSAAPKADRLGSPAPVGDGFIGVKPLLKDGGVPPAPDDLTIPVAPARPVTPSVVPIGGQTEPKKENPVVPAVPAVPPATPMGGGNTPPLPALPGLPDAAKLPTPEGPKLPSPDAKLPMPPETKPPVVGSPVGGSDTGPKLPGLPADPVKPMLPALPGNVNTGTTGGMGTTGGTSSGIGAGVVPPTIAIAPPPVGMGGGILPKVEPDLGIGNPIVPKSPTDAQPGGVKLPGELNPMPPAKLEFSKPPAAPPITPGSGATERAPTTSYDVDLHQTTTRDTWESISREFYNDTRYAAGLRAFNHNKALKDCPYVEVPPLHIVKRSMPAAVAPAGGVGTPVGTGSAAPAEWKGEQTFRVPTGGMTFMAIARMTLGSDQKWDDIARLNPTHRPDERLPAGTEVKLPPGARISN